MDFDWLAPVVPLAKDLNFWGSFGIIVLSVFLFVTCYYGCQVYHSLMDASEDNQHVLLNIAYQHFAYSLQGTAIVNEAKASK